MDEFGVQGEKGGGLFMDQCQTEVTNSSFDSNSASLLGTPHMYS